MLSAAYGYLLAVPRPAADVCVALSLVATAGVALLRPSLVVGASLSQATLVVALCAAGISIALGSFTVGLLVQALAAAVTRFVHGRRVVVSSKQLGVLFCF